MLAKRIRRILLEKEALDYPMTRRILARLPRVPVEVIEDRRVLQAPEHERARWLPEAKTTLLLAVQKGPFRRPCPGTKDYLCCGYQVLQVALNCPMDCTYCVLQGYVNVPAITVFVNVEDLLAELDARTGRPTLMRYGAWAPGSSGTAWPWIGSWGSTSA